MFDHDLQKLLREVASGRTSPDEAARLLAQASERSMGFARIDTDRPRRTGLPEVIFCPGKSPEHVIKIVTTLREAGQNILATRATPELAAQVVAAHPDVVYHPAARCLTVEVTPRVAAVGQVAVVSAGTADLPVAEEAAETALLFGNRVERMTDVGVAGLHRLLARLDVIRAARVCIVIAGMEGALASVVAGLVARPMIAVPTSVGYGANFGGLAALLGMLTSCAGGVGVVNIDNGFGAACLASLINQ